MKLRHRLILPLSLLVLLGVGGLACQGLSGLPVLEGPENPQTDTATPTALPPAPVRSGDENPDEPVFIIGDIPYTSPFFIDTLSESFVLLEDQAGFVRRDREFEFSLAGQAIGPVEVREDETLAFSLALPSVPQGTLLDVDNDGSPDTGVQIFAVAYWSNTWGGPFLEDRDGKGSAEMACCSPMMTRPGLSHPDTTW
jgi:hypothetical protein